MGLSGRKAKQRIPQDPRNLSWAEDASRFGSTYLAKLGFDHGDKNATLGVSGVGLAQHLKVHHKLDMLGVGAQHSKDPNGIAWKQNRDFENLLKRLNANSDEPEDDGVNLIPIEGFRRAGVDEPAAGPVGTGPEMEGRDEGGKVKERKPKKKKRSRDDCEVSKTEERKSKKRRQTVESTTVAAGSEPVEEGPSSSNSSTPNTVPIPRNPHRQGRAHRSRFIASKRLVATSSTAVAEILGIPSSSITPLSGLGLATPKVGPLVEADEHGHLRVSSKSVADYFKEKMRLVVSKHECSETVSDEDPPGGIGLRLKVSSCDGVEEDGGLRGGIGMAPRIKNQMSTATAVTEVFAQNETPGGGNKKRRSEGGEGEASRKPKKKGKKKPKVVSTSVPWPLS